MKLHAQGVSKLVAASLLSMLVVHANASEKPHDTQGPETSGNSLHVRTHRHRRTSKADLFLGYSHFRAVPTYADGNRMVALNGGEAALAFNFTRHFALVADFGGYADGQLRLNGVGTNLPRDVNSNGRAYTFLAGPKFSFNKGARISPFVQVFGGAIHATPVTISGCSGGTACTALPAQTAFAMTAGGGVDIRLTHHLALRLIQAEYLMTRFSNVDTGAGSRQNDMRLSSGLVFSFGGGRRQETAKQPPVVTCSADPTTIYAGSNESVGVHAVATDPQNEALSYTWSANAGAVEGAGPDVRWNSTGTQSGAYSVRVTVKDTHGASTDCSAGVQVETQQNRSPAVSCSADRTSVISGEPVQITAVASDADGDPVSFSWVSTGGQITGASASINLDTSNLAAGSYVVTGHATDGRNGVTDCSVELNVQARTPTPLEARLALHSIYFPTAQPTEQHPGAGLVVSQKATLTALATDFQTYLQAKPNAQLTLEGHADPRGSAEYNQRLSERRVEVTKAFLVAHGVPEGAIHTKAFGLQRELTQAEVTEAVQQNPELTSEQRERLLQNSTTIVLASNRRVDVTLSGTGQQSTRVYPFNAADSLTLLRQQQEGKPAARKSRQVR